MDGRKGDKSARTAGEVPAKIGSDPGGFTPPGKSGKRPLPLPILFLKNQALERPFLFGTRALAAAAFGAGAVFLSGWFGARLHAGTAVLQNSAPALFDRGFTHLLHMLLSALLPLMVISQAVTALASLFKNADARFLLALPLSPSSLFFSRGIRIYGTATGFFYLGASGFSMGKDPDHRSGSRWRS